MKLNQKVYARYGADWRPGVIVAIREIKTGFLNRRTEVRYLVKYDQNHINYLKVRHKDGGYAEKQEKETVTVVQSFAAEDLAERK